MGYRSQTAAVTTHPRRRHSSPLWTACRGSSGPTSLFRPRMEGKDKGRGDSSGYWRPLRAAECPSRPKFEANTSRSGAIRGRTRLFCARLEGSASGSDLEIHRRSRLYTQTPVDLKEWTSNRLRSQIAAVLTHLRRRHSTPLWTACRVSSCPASLFRP